MMQPRVASGDNNLQTREVTGNKLYLLDKQSRVVGTRADSTSGGFSVGLHFCALSFLRHKMFTKVSELNRFFETTCVKFEAIYME
jgi:hypothetical protein